MEAELGEEKWQFIEGCQRDWDALPPPGPPLTVGSDGGLIYAQVRTKVLNDQLREIFVSWYPGMQTEQETEIEKKAA
jgi:hypothetical protein